MIFNTIMVQLDSGSPAAPRLNFAMELARTFEADLMAFSAEEVEVVVPTGEASVIAAELMQQHREEAQVRLRALKEEFLSIAGGREHVSWRSEIGNPTRLLAMHARAADLVVVGNPATDANLDPHRAIDPGELILSTGRPVLLAASDLSPLTAKRVLVAWKDTREARRAVADAMPFLVNAKDVLVATIAEGDQKAARESAADVVRFLMRHGAKARSDVLGIGSGDNEQALAQMARETGADLVVAGGYGHSRIREWAFGGVTRSLLSEGGFHRLVSN
jgi:nucleotide-binding universal stress UspA family protein